MTQCKCTCKNHETSTWLYTEGRSTGRDFSGTPRPLKNKQDTRDAHTTHHMKGCQEIQGQKWVRDDHSMNNQSLQIIFCAQCSCYYMRIMSFLQYLAYLLHSAIFRWNQFSQRLVQFVSQTYFVFLILSDSAKSCFFLNHTAFVKNPRANYLVFPIVL